MHVFHERRPDESTEKSLLRSNWYIRSIIAMKYFDTYFFVLTRLLCISVWVGLAMGPEVWSQIGGEIKAKVRSGIGEHYISSFLLHNNVFLEFMFVVSVSLAPFLPITCTSVTGCVRALWRNILERGHNFHCIRFDRGTWSLIYRYERVPAPLTLAVRNGKYAMANGDLKTNTSKTD